MSLDGDNLRLHQPTTRVPKTSELIARQLADYIVTNRLQENVRLPPESEMMENLGVARGTLREALRLLEIRGVITMKSGPRGGPIVRRPRPADLQEALSLHLQLNDASLSDVLDGRRGIEPLITRLCARRITPEQLDTLDENIAAMRRDADNGKEFHRLTVEFHGVIAVASGSIVLQLFNDSLKAIADGVEAGVQYSKTQVNAVSTAHERILESLRAADEEGAEREMLAHLEEGGRYWRRHYPDLVTRPVQWHRP